MDFVVIDTEGNPVLREVAILDSQGQLLYEAFSDAYSENYNSGFTLTPLKQIVQKIATIARFKRIICHYVNHDLDVLRYSFRKAQVPWSGFTTACTWELAQHHLPNVASYSLEHLSKHLHLNVSGRRFNSRQAHTARYDAEFTYQLYLKILERQQQAMSQTQLSQTKNPFSSSRVDTPFQDHVDFEDVYQAEFELLKSILGEINADPNHQSKGAIVIGEPGSGKTHLIMRMAKELLGTNRLLFIRQPNNATAVLHHTYSRILESFAEKVPGRDRTQLELLLAKSFVNILSSLPKVINTQRGREVLTALQNDALNLFDRLGTEGGQRHRDGWRYIEQHINEWWSQQYTAAGNAAIILKGIIKFCSYIDPQKKDLVRRWLSGFELEEDDAESVGLTNWQAEMSQEEFALEAISVFGKLSILDEPLIIVFDQLEGLGLPPNAPILESFGSAVKELLTYVPNSLIILNLFPDRWEQFKWFFDGAVVDRVSQYTVHLKRPSREQLENLLSLKAEAVEIELKDCFDTAALNDILSQKSIRAMLNRASAYFRYKANGISLPPDPQVPIENLSLDSRVKQLEHAIAQIIQLVQPFMNHTSLGEINSDRTKPDAPSKIVGMTGEPSTEDAVFDYLEQKKIELTNSYSNHPIITDADEIGKLAMILEAFKVKQELSFEPLRLGRNKLPENFRIKTVQKEFAIGFLNAGGNAFTARIKHFNEVVSREPKTKFVLIRDARESKITGKVGVAEIEKLKHSPNGKFLVIERDDRVNFDLIYGTIIDIQERDLDVDLRTALDVLISYLSNYWLIQLLVVIRGDIRQ